MLSIRLIASPALSVGVAEAFRQLAGHSLLACTHDDEVGVSVFALRSEPGNVQATAHALLESIGGAHAPGRAFRLELHGDAAGDQIGDELMRAIAVDAHGILSSPVYIAKRTVPLSLWGGTRPMRWDREGLTVGNVAPTLPFSGSACAGLALESGTKTVLTKAKVAGAALGTREEDRIAAAAGGGSSGFADVSVIPLGRPADGSSLFAIELEAGRTALHRVLEVLEIEARRYGARLGCGALLSDAPLQLFTAALATAMGLPVRKEQIIETHLPNAATQT
jgi:hypothetical protein